MTLALVNEGYLLKAPDRISSETSLLKSPTNNLNHATTPKDPPEHQDTSQTRIPQGET